MQSSKPPETIFSWAGSGAPVFGGSATSTPGSIKTGTGAESSEEEEGQDDSHDPHFEPVVPLPEVIEVRTGEEEEEKLFCQRARLFRFDPATKEWKERGVGEMKLLHHVANGTFRLLLRREQVHKVVLNQLLTTAVELTRMVTNNNAWCWAGVNFAEDEPMLEKLAVRFKNEDILQEFYAKVEESKATLAAQQSVQAAAASDNSAEAAAPEEAPTAEQGQEEAEEEEAGEEDYETYDEDDDDEEEDDEDAVLFEKRVTLLTRGANDPEGQWRGLGQGTLRVIHDVELCGMRVLVEADSTGELVCSLPVHPGASMQQHEKECHFSGHDEITDSTTIKHFNARFSSKQAAEEFKLNFLEGLEMAEQAYEEEGNEQ